MAKIQVLPDALVNQIAAGEVIERPASVVKELVENALDAGATRVAVDVENGGISRIAVEDDGSGMSPEDALVALERHATSKIRSFDDLTRIASLGFRGEALPSIASVSRLVLTTSPDGSGLGTEVVAERGEAARSLPARHPKGTRVVVEELFANVPARRKFLKARHAETRAVVKAVTSLALARPDVAFRLSAEGEALLDFPAARDAAGRFLEVLSSASAAEVVPVAHQVGGTSLRGVVTRPTTSFASRASQWFFVNGRLAKDATVFHAATLAARDVLRVERHPAWALFLTCDPAQVDVNVHPQKLEVRFRDPGAVHAVVHRGLRDALSGGGGATALSPERSLSAPVPAFSSVSKEPGVSSSVAEALGLYDRPARFEPLLPAPAVSRSRAAWSDARSLSPVGPLRLLGQYRDSFLVAEGEDGIVLVDQHVAHERVRYERILPRLEQGSNPSQTLLIPVTYEATAEEALLLEESDALLVDAGFAISSLSGRRFVVSGAPADCPGGAVEPFLRELLARLAVREDAGGDPLAARRQALAASLACRGAVTVNTPMRSEEATRLLADLSACRDPFTCPHGRPILLTLEHGELVRRFGRSS